MEYLFTEKNLNVLRSFTLGQTLFAFDFDGTLAPIVDTPENARLDDHLHSLLKSLNEIVPVAIISGRSLDDLKKRLDFVPRHLIGNHGLEGIHDEKDLIKMHDLTRFWMKFLKNQTSKFASTGIYLEDKIYSLSLHFKNAADLAEAESLCLKVAYDLPEIKLVRGKHVLNLIPIFGCHKGDAFSRLLRAHDYKFGFYAGDDYTDEDVFRLNLSNILTVKVGSEGSSSAKYFLKSQSEAELLLQTLVNFTRY